MCVHVCVQEGKRGRWCQEGHEHVCVTEGACLGERGKSVALHDSQPEPGLWSKAWQGISLWLPAEPPPRVPSVQPAPDLFHPLLSGSSQTLTLRTKPEVLILQT